MPFIAPDMQPPMIASLPSDHSFSRRSERRDRHTSPDQGILASDRRMSARQPENERPYVRKTGRFNRLYQAQREQSSNDGRMFDSQKESAEAVQVQVEEFYPTYEASEVVFESDGKPDMAGIKIIETSSEQASVSLTLEGALYLRSQIFGEETENTSSNSGGGLRKADLKALEKLKEEPLRKLGLGKEREMVKNNYSIAKTIQLASQIIGLVSGEISEDGKIDPELSKRIGKLIEEKISDMDDSSSQAVLLLVFAGIAGTLARDKNRKKATQTLIAVAVLLSSCDPLPTTPDATSTLPEPGVTTISKPQEIQNPTNGPKPVDMEKVFETPTPAVCSVNEISELGRGYAEHKTVAVLSNTGAAEFFGRIPDSDADPENDKPNLPAGLVEQIAFEAYRLAMSGRGNAKVVIPEFAPVDQVKNMILELVALYGGNASDIDMSFVQYKKGKKVSGSYLMIAVHGGKKVWGIRVWHNGKVHQREDESFTVAGVLMRYENDGQGYKLVPVKNQAGKADIAQVEGCRQRAVKVSGDGIVEAVLDEVEGNWQNIAPEQKPTPKPTVTETIDPASRYPEIFSELGIVFPEGLTNESPNYKLAYSEALVKNSGVTKFDLTDTATQNVGLAKLASYAIYSKDSQDNQQAIDYISIIEEKMKTGRIDHEDLTELGSQLISLGPVEILLSGTGRTHSINKIVDYMVTEQEYNVIKHQLNNKGIQIIGVEGPSAGAMTIPNDEGVLLSVGYQSSFTAEGGRVFTGLEHLQKSTPIKTVFQTMNVQFMSVSIIIQNQMLPKRKIGNYMNAILPLRDGIFCDKGGNKPCQLSDLRPIISR